MCSFNFTGNYYTVYTPGDGLLQFADIKPRSQYVMFSVKAEREAVVALLPPEDSVELGASYYEVIIGANDNNEMHIVKVHKDTKVVLKAVSYVLENMLPKDLYRFFYRNWDLLLV